MDLDLGDTRAIIAECRKQGLLRNQTAYVLATARWETGRKMKPVREGGGEKYLKSKAYYPFVGMGYVQLTWRRNYAKASKVFGVDFVENPKLLLDPKFATPILVTGMKEGWFTGKKLSHYITVSGSDFKGARRIVNGTDRAVEIARLAEEYDALLLAEGYGVDAAAPPKPSIPRPDEDPGPVARQPDDPGVDPADKPVEPKTPGLVALVAAAVMLGLIAIWDWLISAPCNLLGVFCS